MGVLFDLGLRLAQATAQIAAKPRHHQRRALGHGQLFAQSLERIREIAAAADRVDIGRGIGPQPRVEMHRRGGQSIFARTRDHADTRNNLIKALMRLRRLSLRGAHHLEGKLRDPVAKARQIKVFDHHISNAAIAGRIACTLDSGDFWVGQLRLVAMIKPQRQLVGGNLDPVGPNPAQPSDAALAKGHRKADGIAVLCRALYRARPALAAAAADRGGVDMFQKPAGPDHLPRQPHPAPDMRNRRAFAGPHHPKPLDPPDLDRF